MSELDSLTGFERDEDGTLWIRSYVGNARIAMWYKVKNLLYYEKSAFQEISIVDTKGFGKMLVLDGTPQNSVNDGYIYNEMISHIPIVTHPDPKKIAMIGGGDCGPAREAMKYQGIEQIDVVEIDQRVTEACRKWLTPAAAFENEPRFHMNHMDGLEWIKMNKNSYDVLIIDRPDPVGPAAKLFTPDFYHYVFESLKKEGIVVFQSGSPYYNQSTLQKTVKNLKRLFPIVRTYLVNIPLFPCGVWSLTLASKKWDPLGADLNKLQDKDTQYVNKDIFLASFKLPNYVRELVDD